MPPKRKAWEPAPAHLIKLDYNCMFESYTLRTSHEVEKLLFLHSVRGHAHEGHGMIGAGSPNVRYINTTTDDIVLAVGQKPKDVKEKGQKIVDEILGFIDKAIEGNLEYLVNEDGEPLLGIEMFKDMKIKDNQTFLIGAYLASVMDNYDWRKKVACPEHYGLEMGGGKCCAINMRNMLLAGEDFETLSREEQDLERLREWEIIPRRPKKGKVKPVESSETWQNGYVRLKKGKGVSDDAALIISGKLYPGEDPCSAALGVYVIDLIDTIDKYLPYIEEGGVDEMVGPRIENSKVISLTEDEIIKAVYLFAVPPKMKMPDCSQRYFLEIDPHENQTALESHLKYLQGKPFKEMKIGSRKGTRIRNTVFYERIEERLKEL